MELRPISQEFWTHFELEVATLRLVAPRIEEDLRMWVASRAGEIDRDLEFPARVTHDMVNHLLPQTFRLSHCLSLYSVFESTILSIASTLHGVAGLAQWRRRHREDPFTTAAKDYFADQLDVDLYPDDKTFSDAQTLEAVRHAAIHANGLRELARAATWERLSNAAATGTPLSTCSGRLELDSEYVQQAGETIEIIVTRAIEQARQRIDQVSWQQVRAWEREVRRKRET